MCIPWPAVVIAMCRDYLPAGVWVTPLSRRKSPQNIAARRFVDHTDDPCVQAGDHVQPPRCILQSDRPRARELRYSRFVTVEHLAFMNALDPERAHASQKVFGTPDERSRIGR